MPRVSHFQTGTQVKLTASLQPSSPAPTDASRNSSLELCCRVLQDIPPLIWKDWPNGQAVGLQQAKWGFSGRRQSRVHCACCIDGPKNLFLTQEINPIRPLFLQEAWFNLGTECTVVFVLYRIRYPWTGHWCWLLTHCGVFPGNCIITFDGFSLLVSDTFARIFRPFYLNVERMKPINLISPTFKQQEAVLKATAVPVLWPRLGGGGGWGGAFATPVHCTWVIWRSRGVQAGHPWNTKMVTPYTKRKRKVLCLFMDIAQQWCVQETNSHLAESIQYPTQGWLWTVVVHPRKSFPSNLVNSSGCSPSWRCNWIILTAKGEAAWTSWALPRENHPGTLSSREAKNVTNILSLKEITKQKQKGAVTHSGWPSRHCRKRRNKPVDTPEMPATNGHLLFSGTCKIQSNSFGNETSHSSTTTERHNCPVFWSFLLL